jgi:hypothetical protein
MANICKKSAYGIYNLPTDVTVVNTVYFVEITPIFALWLVPIMR